MRASIRGKEVQHAGSISATVMGGSVNMLRCDDAAVHIRHAVAEAFGAARRRVGAFGRGGDGFHSAALLLRVTFPAAEVLAEPAEEFGDCLGEFGGVRCALSGELVDRVSVPARSRSHRHDLELLLVPHLMWDVWLHRLRRMPPHLARFLRPSFLWSLGFL
ncbi:unnamed protein product [Cuscuta epithymum]|uniref:Uncharacterized protein n=1 Tax=Cuscuta epithymum TaxID=186058 RepID=A0AAV0C6P8_9ASTE|nr:unnamed protein product [Cuscuta epithymum]